MLIILEDLELAELGLADETPGAVEEDRLVDVEFNNEWSTLEPPVVVESLRFRLVVLVRVDEDEEDVRSLLVLFDEDDEEDEEELDMDVLSGAWLLFE